MSDLGRRKQRQSTARHHLAAQLVRSWRDHFIEESNGTEPLLLVGGKALLASDIFTNIAYAIDALPRPKVAIGDPHE